MSLFDDVEQFLRNDESGRRLYGNAIGGAGDGLYVLSEAEALLAAAAQNALPYESTDSLENIEAFKQVFNGIRFHERPGNRPTIRVDEVSTPHRDSPDLNGQTVYSVTTMSGLRHAMSEEDIRRLASNGITIRLDGTVEDEAAFLASLALLSPEEASFVIHSRKGMGRFIIWFTIERCFIDAQTRCSSSSDPISLAESLRSRNGLGHRKAGEWLVLLKIPGSIVQKAGHYRPVFCEGGVGSDCWFMSRSSDHGRFDGGPWGQTCDLEALQAGAATYDGAMERVALQPRQEHLGSDRIGFEVLGKVDARYGKADAMARLTDGIWTRKDL